MTVANDKGFILILQGGGLQLRIHAKRTDKFGTVRCVTNRNYSVVLGTLKKSKQFLKIL